jgi:hypothetical protein
MKTIKQPKTLTSLKNYRYGVTEKYPKGTAYDPAQCGWIVRDEKAKSEWQCSRKSGYGKNGLWCPNHATTS